MKRLILTLKKLERKIYYILFEKPISSLVYHLPIKSNRIIFDNFGGKGYGDNPKYIAEELLKEDKKHNLEIYWLVDNLMPKEKYKEFPKEINIVKIDSFKGLIARATSKIWVDNVRHLHPVKKKDNQFYLQTWHSDFPLKYVEKEAEKLLDKKYIKEAKYDGNITNAILVDNKSLEKLYRTSFWLNPNVEYLRYGSPRNDEFYKIKKDPSYINELRKKYNIDANCCYVLYAPTFRDDYSMDGYILKFEEIKKAFEKKYNKKCKIVIRLHPNVALQAKELKFNEDILNGTDYPNVQVLALLMDVVISDYSSTVFDFVILKKPVFMCGLDFEKYQEERGLSELYFNSPFEITTTIEELIDLINKFNYDKYVKKVEEFFSDNPLYDKGDSSIKTVKWIRNKLQ